MTDVYSSEGLIALNESARKFWRQGFFLTLVFLFRDSLIS